MPIPDVIMVDQKEKTETEKLNEKAPKLETAVNHLLRKQLTCKKLCCSCVEKCQELQNWLDMEGDI